MDRLAWLAWLALCACAGAHVHGAAAPGPTPAGARPGSPAGVDRALELAAELPGGADRCVVARPARVPAARRSALARLSQAEPLAWLAELEITAYVEAHRDRRDGPSSQLILLWVDAPPAQVRSAFEARGGLALHWEDGTRVCDPAECPVRARFVREHVISIERGAFVPDARGGVELQCLRMAERSPEAAEISAVRNPTFGAFRLGGLPLRSSAELRASGTGLQVERIDRMQTPEDAERALLEGVVPESTLPRIGGSDADVQRTRVDAALYTRFELAWADLELAREDDARIEAATRDAAALAAVAPDDASPPPGSRQDVLAELGYRLESIGRTSGEPRLRQLHAARALLDQALARNPEDEGLALMLVELLLVEAPDPVAARALVQRFAGRPSANSGWGVLDRQSAALIGADALADALVRHSLVARPRARATAQAILARMREGSSFERAERAELESAR